MKEMPNNLRTYAVFNSTGDIIKHTEAPPLELEEGTRLCCIPNNLIFKSQYSHGNMVFIAFNCNVIVQRNYIYTSGNRYEYQVTGSNVDDVNNAVMYVEHLLNNELYHCEDRLYNYMRRLEEKNRKLLNLPKKGAKQRLKEWWFGETVKA